MPLQNVEYYNNLHITSLRSFEHYSSSKYYEMYKRVVMWIVQMLHSHSGVVMDLGCGAGILMSYLKDVGIVTNGCDISPVAVELVRMRNGYAYQHDLDYGAPLKYSVYTCMETLEHLANDVGLIESLPNNVLFIFSVPTFMDKSHVRCFKTAESIQKRYGHLVDIEEVVAYKRRHLVRSIKR